MKAWLIDPSGLRSKQLEVSKKLPQEQVACGSQAFIATLLFDPSMSAFLIIETQKSQKCPIPANGERELGLDRRETGKFYPADELGFCDSNRS